jgi:hypothetical protein
MIKIGQTINRRSEMRIFFGAFITPVGYKPIGVVSVFCENITVRLEARAR